MKYRVKSGSMSRDVEAESHHEAAKTALREEVKDERPCKLSPICQVSPAGSRHGRRLFTTEALAREVGCWGGA